MGTPDYMAPEQIKGQRGNDRTDIYALGMILYEGIAGRLPYEGDNGLAVMSQHINVSPPPIHQFRKQVSGALEEVILKAIRRKPESRWPSARAFVDALTHLDRIDTSGLRAEREQEETEQATKKPFVNNFGAPAWRVGLIVGAALFGLVVVTALVQLVFYAH